ncbi:hypothetical protein FD724_06915 [Nostoc sp. C057]|uniref:hypothetical protein n=1 Tax=Nostoc sp. C057 TaxID=2576903 RepID=UPI0015C314BE|nr:hypothetical protein [Nostoc sp. C057]QLE47868.1 hypothetical protein FD724_06915 [Nostoc sp. C057]
MSAVETRFTGTLFLRKSLIASIDSMDEAEGLVTWDINKKIADIKLVKPEEYPFDQMRPYEMEAVLVHELLHLHFAPFDAKTELQRE